MRIRSTRAVVAKTLKLSDSSKLVSLITADHGLVKAVAKGARRPKSVFGAALEPVTLITCMIYYRESRDLQYISGADIIDSYDDLKNDLTVLAVASAIVEIALSQTAIEDPKANTFELVAAGLDELRIVGKPHSEKALWRFVLRLLDAAGYRPTLDTCVKCGSRPRGGPAFLSFADGGVVCTCSETDSRFGIKVSPGALMAMKRLMLDDTAQVTRLKIAPAQHREIERVVFQFLAYHTGTSRPPHALAFLRKLEGMSKN
jgi:DNA repair protein RecO (recombination protein O)